MGFYESIPYYLGEAIEFQPDKKPWPPNVKQKTRQTCSDPQCGDSTWDHNCDLGELLDEWHVWNGLHKSHINLEPGDIVVCQDPNDCYPVKPELFKKKYRII